MPQLNKQPVLLKYLTQLCQISPAFTEIRKRVGKLHEKPAQLSFGGKRLEELMHSLDILCRRVEGMREPLEEFYRKHELFITRNILQPSARMHLSQRRIIERHIDFDAVEELAVELQLPETFFRFRRIKILIEWVQLPPAHADIDLAHNLLLCS